jgi:hypothetical protein
MIKIKDGSTKPKVVGRSRATVIDNRDPLLRGRIRVDHPLLGQTSWIPYLKMPHCFDVPSVGDLVYVECDSAYIEYPIAWGNVTKGAMDHPQLPEVFKQEIVPQNRGMYTPGGHLFEMHDGKATPTPDPAVNNVTAENRGIRWTSIGGHKIAIDDQDNRIFIRTDAGNFIIIDDKNSSVDINSKGTINSASAAGTKIVAGTMVKVETVETNLDSTLRVSGTSNLAGGTPLVLATAQFIGTGNRGAPVISTIMSGQATKVFGS